MNRKTYMKNIYSKYWIVARKKKYGFSEYEKNLCYYIGEKISKESKILEVAIGTGFPFGDFFQNRGYKVYGVDIAPLLIEECKKLNVKINCKVGDAENLDYRDNFFSCTYCFNSTSYFDDLCKVIDEMVRVTIPNGMIIFDIQNRNNKEIIQNYNKMCLEKSNQIRKLFRYAKNLGKIILRKGVPDWTNVIHEIPIYPKMIYQHLTRLNIKYFKVFVQSNENAKLEIKNEVDFLDNYLKIIFVITK